MDSLLPTPKVLSLLKQYFLLHVVSITSSYYHMVTGCPLLLGIRGRQLMFLFRVLMTYGNPVLERGPPGPKRWLSG